MASCSSCKFARAYVSPSGAELYLCINGLTPDENCPKYAEKPRGSHIVYPPEAEE